jgi:alanyl-tRNA synthetase
MKDYADLRMHTAEHLLNRTVASVLGCGRAFSSHIEHKKSKCDYHFGRDLTPEERTEIERRVNSAIKADLPVREEFIAGSGSGVELDFGRLPKGAALDKVRVIRIGDYDICPCIGPHAGSTAELGGFRIISTGFADGVLRIRFRLAAVLPPAG